MIIGAYTALSANWACVGITIVILLVRLAATRFRDKSFDVASLLVAVAIAISAGRIVMVYYYLAFGTSNDVLHGTREYFDESDLGRIKKGSILIIGSRIMITTFYWTQISLLLLFYSTIVRDSHWRNTIRVCWLVVLVTYIGVVLATTLECRPFRLYWQIEPDPGQCVRAYIQLFMQGISNIVLDLLLLAISWPILKLRHRSKAQAFRVGLLFILGFFTIIVGCVRMAYIHADNSYQPTRSFWASIQMLTSTFVANAPTIYGCWTIKRRRKSETLARTASRAGPRPSTVNELPFLADYPLTQPTVALIRTYESEAVDEKAWSRHIA
jgi:cytochrome bd-type quinol oxidase subunit 2